MLGVIVTLVCFGLLLFAIEFIVPGGIIGIVGAGCMFAAVILTFLEYGPTAGFVAAVTAFSISLGGLIIWMKYFHRSRIGKALLLEAEVPASEGIGERQSLMGRKGTTKNKLHPTGGIEIDGRRLDAVAEAGMIESGVQVEVVRIDGMNVVVREVSVS